MELCESMKSNREGCDQITKMCRLTLIVAVCTCPVISFLMVCISFVVIKVNWYIFRRSNSASSFFFFFFFVFLLIGSQLSKERICSHRSLIEGEIGV